MKKAKPKGLIVNIIILIIGVVLIGIGTINNKHECIDYKYTIKRDAFYKVLLKPNNFYSKSKLPSGLNYVSKSIDSYLINFKYNQHFSKKINSDYTYNVVIDLVGNFKDSDGISKKIWTKKFIYQPKQKVKLYQKDTINLKSEVMIDYDYYKELVNNFENTYKIKIDAVLEVKFNVLQNYKGKDLKDKIVLEIPITETITGINRNYKKESKITIKKENHNIIYYYIIGLGFISTSFIYLLIYNYKRIRQESTQLKNLKQILKEYKNIIIQIKKDIKIDGIQTIDILNLDDLVAIAVANNTNIIFFEDSTIAKSIFYVIIGNIIYRFIME